MNDTPNTLGNLPELPIIESILWSPPQQTDPTHQATSEVRLKLYAITDLKDRHDPFSTSSNDWDEYIPDQVASNADLPGVLVNYWDGNPPADYTLTMRSYWMLIPDSYTKLSYGERLEKTYTCTSGANGLDDLCKELGLETETVQEGYQAVDDNLSIKLSDLFSRTITTIPETSATTYDVDSPAEGYTRIWMLWQLVYELVALDPNGNVVSNPTRRGDVNWSEHNKTGAYLNYTNLHQHFPTTLILPTQRDFPT